ncbi:hypothetical protein HZS_4972 [Henneguya salminicola]|nr:hypothetical protein HZS_4972 [Henneguya salminicola]
MKKSFKIINKYNTKFLNSRSNYIGSDLSQEPNRIFEEINSNPLENLEDDDLKARINAILKKTRTSNKHKMKSKSAKR